MWIVGITAAWLALSCLLALGLGLLIRRARELDQDEGGPDCD